MSAQQALRPGGRRELAARASLALIALMWSLPFLQPVHHYPLPAFYSEWLAFVLGLAAMGLLAGRRAWQHGEFPIVACAPLALAALILVQTAWGRVPYAGQGLTAVLYALWSALLIALAAELRRRIDLSLVVQTLAWCLVLSGLVSVGMGAIQYYEVQPIFAGYVLPADSLVYGNLAQRNHYGDYLSLATAAALYLYGTGRSRGWVTGLIVVMLVFGIGLSASRSVWLYLAALVIVGAWYAKRAPGRDGRRMFTGAVAVIAVFALDQWFMSSGVLTHGTSPTATQRVFGETSHVKIEHLRVVWSMFSESPVLGAGWGQFPWSDFAYKTVSSGSTLASVTHNAHNLFSHLLAETGLVGASIIGLAAIAWLVDAWRKCDDAESCWILMSVAVLGIHSMLEYPLWHAHFLGIAAVLIGLGATRTLALPQLRVIPASLLIVVTAGAVNAAYLFEDYRDLARITASTVADRSLRVRSLEALSDRDVLLRPYAEFLMANDMPLDDRFLSEKLAANEQVLRFFPAPMVVYRHAALLALAGRADDAAAWLARARSAYPAALPNAVGALRPLAAAYPAQIAPLLELASAKTPPAVPAQ